MHFDMNGNDLDLKLVLKLATEGHPSFYPVFKKVLSEFDSKLRSLSPSLNPEDLEVCAYTRMGFRTLQIAYYKKTTTRAVESRKYRIRKRINIPKQKNFMKYINDI